MTTGIVFDIQKFSVHDGPGIRTTVFLKGCPLRCSWCHNPESWHGAPELLYDAEKCVGCRACASLCPRGCHRFGEDGAHRLDRGACVGCGACVERCRPGALELCGRVRTTAEVLHEVLKDKPFYDNSGGGLTVSGGEPLFQAAFTEELLRGAKAEGLHTCLETCGFAPWERLEALLPLVDLFLYDVKCVDAARHREFTGQDNALILENLSRLSRAGARLRLRCPLVPGLNDGESDLAALGRLAESLSGQVEGVDVEPYHPLGVSKARRLGHDEVFAAPFTPQETWESWVSAIASRTSVPVRKQ